MRKASRVTIEATLRQYDDWRAGVDKRASQLTIVGAAADVADWADDVRGRIMAGDVGDCTSALARSVIRLLEDCESGFYVERTPTGGYRCAAAM